MKIIESRLTGIRENMIEPDAIQFASRKVAAVSGDARRALDICRRAVEIAESECLVTEPEQNTPSKRERRKPAFLLEPGKRLGKVTINTIKMAIAEATSTPTQQYLRSLPLSSKVFLAAFLARIRRSGVSESILREILDEAKRSMKMTNGGSARDYLEAPKVSLPVGSTAIKHSRMLSTARVVAMEATVVALAEAGVISLEARKGERTAKVRLNASETDIKLAFQGNSELEEIEL